MKTAKNLGNWLLVANPGYARFELDTVRQNISGYSAKGGYLRLGTEHWFRSKSKNLLFTLGAQMVLSAYREEGAIYLKGKVFGNLYLPFQVRQQRVGAAYVMGLYKRIGRLYLGMQARLGAAIWCLENTKPSYPTVEWPSFYAPGLGRYAFNPQPNALHSPACRQKRRLKT
jgi:hypothetical protein